MKKAVIHMIIWLVVLSIVLLVSKTENELFDHLFWVWLSCAMFYFVNAILEIKQMNPKEGINADGILSGRLLGIWLNAFVIQYLLEMYENLILILIYGIVGFVGIYLYRESNRDFLSRNNWKKGYGALYLSMTLLISSILSLIGFLNADWLLVQDIEEMSVKGKVILLFIFIAIIFLTVIPDNIVAKLISRRGGEQDVDDFIE